MAEIYGRSFKKKISLWLAIFCNLFSLPMRFKGRCYPRQDPTGMARRQLTVFWDTWRGCWTLPTILPVQVAAAVMHRMPVWWISTVHFVHLFKLGHTQRLFSDQNFVTVPIQLTVLVSDLSDVVSRKCIFRKIMRALVLANNAVALLPNL